MEAYIFKLFQNNKALLAEVERIVAGFREQNYDLALRKTARSLSYINSIMELLPDCREYLAENGVELDKDIFMPILQELLSAQEKKDYILLADLYEMRLATVLYQLQELICSAEQSFFENDLYMENIEILNHTNPELVTILKSGLDGQVEKGYSVEPTSGGDMTLTVEFGGNKQYLHSNISVWKEAYFLARSWYSGDKAKYIIYGLGLGYHIYELYQLNEYMILEIYESDIQIIRMACSYTDNIKLFRNPNIKLIYDPDFTRLADRLEHIEEDEELLIHYPSLTVVNNKPVKEKLENYFIRHSSVKNQLCILNGNFNHNIRNYSSFVDELQLDFKGKNLYIIAAGPSLDHNFMRLHEITDRNKCIILATGTVFRKLINAGIKPDYVLVTDPNARVYKQIAGLEDCDVPMLYLSTAYYGFAANYKGKKYLVCQKDYPKAEEFAEEKGLQLFQTGGSVSTTALDIGITFGCRRIIFLGLDLAYTDDYAHASDTSRRNAIMTQDMRQVEDIHGKLIYTGRSLDMFRLWIENRIRDVKDMEFIDATEGGARIKGMRIAKLADVMAEQINK